jgi:hypothetical protein
MMFFQRSFAQKKELNYEDVEYTTSKLYNEQKWAELKVYGEDAIRHKFNFYYLNLRTGIACYYLKEFYDAIKHLKNSLKNNYQSIIAKEYLYSSYSNLGMEEEAMSYYQKLPADKMSSYGIKKTKLLDYIYTEGALKLSNETDSIGNTTYFNIGLKHRLSYRFSFYHSYSYLSQNLYWGNYKQHQYYISPKISLPYGFTLQPAYHYIKTNSIILMNDNFLTRVTGTYKTPPPGNLNGFDTTNYSTYQKSAGKVDIHGNLFYLGLNKKIGRFDLYPHASLLSLKKTTRIGITQHTNWKYVEVAPPGPPYFSSGTFDTVFSNNKDTSYSQTQIGLEFSYTLPFYTDRIKFGADINYIAQKSKNLWAWSPYISTKIWKSLWITAEYYHGNIYNIAEKRGSIINNSSDLTTERLSMLCSYIINKRITVYMMYQNESKKEEIFGSKYQFNTILTGLKLNL